MKSKHQPNKQKETLDQLLFVLRERKKPTLVVIGLDPIANREKRRQTLQRALPEYRHHALVLTDVMVVSLNHAIQKQLPDEVLNTGAGECVVHVLGLENSLYHIESNSLKETGLVKEMNYERETLFGEFPFTLVIWASPLLVAQLRKHAPDLWDWIHYYFKFHDRRPKDWAPFSEFSPIPEKADPQLPMWVPRWESKYQLLEKRGEQDDRTIDEKLTLLYLLGDAYRNMKKFDLGLQKYLSALALVEQHAFLSGEKARIYFSLGSAFLMSENFKEAIANYEHSLKEQNKTGHKSNRGATLYQLGLALSARKHYDKAAACYLEAIKWDQKFKEENPGGLVRDYHALGLVKAVLGRWSEAIQDFNHALGLCKKTDPDFMGNLFLDLGIILFEVGLKRQAANYFQKAREWSETHDRKGFERIYTNLGAFYARQGEKRKAVAYFQKAIGLFLESDPNPVALGRTYFSLANVYKEQGRLETSIKHHFKALLALEKTPRDQLKVLRAVEKTLSEAKQSDQLIQTALADFAQNQKNKIKSALAKTKPV